jgi:hypothetical protein
VEAWANDFKKGFPHGRNMITATLYNLAGDTSRKVNSMRLWKDEAFLGGSQFEKLMASALLWTSLNESREAKLAHEVYLEFNELIGRLAGLDVGQTLLGYELYVIPQFTDKILQAQFFSYYGQMVGTEGGIEGKRRSLSLFDTALRFAKEAEEDFRKEPVISEIYLNFGVSLEFLGKELDDNEAMQKATLAYLHSAIASKNSGDLFGAARGYNYAGVLMIERHGFGLGISYLRTACEIAEKIVNLTLKAKGYLWLGTAYFALAHLGLDPEISTNPQFKEITFGDIEDIPEENLRLAKDSFQRAKTFYEELNDAAAVSIARDQLASLQKFKEQIG